MNLVFIILCLNLSFSPLFSIDFRLPCLSGVFLGFILLARAIVYRLFGTFGTLCFRLSTVFSFWPFPGLYQTLWSLSFYTVSGVSRACGKGNFLRAPPSNLTSPLAFSFPALSFGFSALSFRS